MRIVCSVSALVKGSAVCLLAGLGTGLWLGLQLVSGHA